MYVLHDAFFVRLVHADLFDAATRFQHPAFVLHHLAQALNFFAVNGAACHHHLEAVVVLGVVAARDLDAASAQGVGGEIKLRCGHHAHIDDVHTCIHQSLHQGGGQRGPTQATISTHRHCGFALRQRLGAKGFAQRCGHLGVERGGHHTANVISLEHMC